MSNSRSHEVSVLYLLPLRLIVGATFLFAGGSKIASGGLGAAYESTLYEIVSANLENAYAFYRPFLESVGSLVRRGSVARPLQQFQQRLSAHRNPG